MMNIGLGELSPQETPPVGGNTLCANLRKTIRITNLLPAQYLSFSFFVPIYVQICWQFFNIYILHAYLN